MDDDNKPVPTAEERGLTIDTFADRIITGDKHTLARLKPLVKGFEPTRSKLDDTLGHLQSSAVSLAEAGLIDDPELLSTIDSSFRVCLDELALIEIREHELDKIYKDLMEDGNEITDVQGVYRAGCEKNEEDYKNKTDKAKYAKHPRYHEFRERVWETRATGQPMPLLSTLFAKDEASAAANGKGGDDSDSSDDVEMGGMVVSFKCPITLKPMQDPWTSTVCRHSFEKSAIMDYLKGAPQTCPTSGCSVKLDKSKVKANTDLKKRAEADARRVARAREARDDSAEEIDSDGE